MPVPLHVSFLNSHYRTETMKCKPMNAALVWKQMEDLLAPQLSFSVIDRAVYSHLLRHSRLEGKPQFRFSMPWLAGHIRLSGKTTRESVRSLIARGVLRLVERSCQAHHVVHVRLPEEVRAVRAAKTAARGSARTSSAAVFTETNFLQTLPLRRALHAREGGRCFYCLRRLITQRRCLDHVVPQARLGANSYRNLVSCCMHCNSCKRDTSASDFLRSLYREGELSRKDLTGRLAALRALAAGKLRPRFSTDEDSVSAPAKP